MAYSHLSDPSFGSQLCSLVDHDARSARRRLLGGRGRDAFVVGVTVVVRAWFFKTFGYRRRGGDSWRADGWYAHNSLLVHGLSSLARGIGCALVIRIYPPSSGPAVSVIAMVLSLMTPPRGERLMRAQKLA